MSRIIYYKLEIKYNKDQDWFELWQHILNNPNDELYPIKYSNFISFNKNKNILKDIVHKECNNKAL
jgi:hypothetical protein